MRKYVHLEAARGIGAIIVASWHILPYFYSFFAVKLTTFALTTPVIGPIIYGACFFFFDGALAVHFFFVLSGYVLSIRWFAGDAEYDVTKAAFRRYIRLALPVFGSSLAAFLLIKGGMFYLHDVRTALYPGQAVIGGQANFYQFDHTFLTMLKSAFFDAMFNFDFRSSLNPVLWTIMVEFYGSLLLFALLALMKRFRWPLLALGLVMAFLQAFAYIGPNAIYYCYGDMVWGMIYAYLCTRHAVITNGEHRLAKSILGAVLILAGCIAGAMDFTLFFASVPGNSLAGNIIFLGVLISLQYREFMSGRLSRLLGRLSFSVYLVHYLLIISLFTGVLSYFAIGHGWRLQTALAVAVLLYYPVLAATAMLFATYIDAPSIALSKRLADFFYLPAAGRRTRPAEVAPLARPAAVPEPVSSAVLRVS